MRGRIQDHLAKRINELLSFFYRVIIDTQKASAEVKNEAWSGAALMFTTFVPFSLHLKSQLSEIRNKYLSILSHFNLGYSSNL